jgi:hypothetical protein
MLRFRKLSHSKTELIDNQTLPLRGGRLENHMQFDFKNSRPREWFEMPPIALEDWRRKAV